MSHANGKPRAVAPFPEDRLPPQNLDAERAVLGAVLIDNDAMHEVAAILATPDRFWRDDHQVIYRAVRGLYDAGKPFDAQIVDEELVRLKLADRIGGPGDVGFLLGELINSVAHAANARHHAEIVRSKAHARDVISAARRVIERGYAQDMTAADYQAFAEREVFGAGAGQSHAAAKPMHDAARRELERIERRRAGIVQGVSSGFPDLDKIIDGFNPTQLIILAARPAAGKSSLALNLAEHAALDGALATLFVSQEMSDEEIAGRSFASRTGVKHQLIRTATMKDHELDALYEQHAKYRDRGRFWIDDGPGRTVPQIAAMARRFRASDDLQLLIVDYLQLLESDGEGRESRQEQVSRISRGLKRIAMELRIPVVALSQLNREVEARNGDRPRLSDLRESGAIENDANIVILLHQPDKDADLVEAIVAKNRSGPTGVVRLAFLRDRMRFESAAPDGREAPDFGPAPGEPY